MSERVAQMAMAGAVSALVGGVVSYLIQTNRMWFWGPQWHWFGWRTLVPFSRGGDQWERHTIVFGWTITGRVIVAVSGPCSGDETCSRRGQR